MKKFYLTGIVSALLFLTTDYYAQIAYHKGSLLVSVSEGSTWARYTTNDNPIDNEYPPIKHEGCIGGTRDPLIIEYGLTDRWSIGLTSGADIFKVKPSKFYGFENSNDEIKITTGEVTVDFSYHVFVNKRLDLSVSSSAGFFSTNFNESYNDITYKYTANGTIARIGTRARYYFWKRFGAFGMVSSYFASSSPKDVKGNTIANTYSTNINGFAIEGGLCFRFF